MEGKGAMQSVSWIAGLLLLRPFQHLVEFTFVWSGKRMNREIRSQGFNDSKPTSDTEGRS